MKNEQAFVGGFIELLDIATIGSSGNSLSVICNEEGKIMGLPLNKPITNRDDKILDVIAGDCLIAMYNDEGDTVSIPKETANKYVNFIRKYKVIPYLY